MRATGCPPLPELTERIRDFLSGELGLSVDDLEPDTALVSSGLLDSVALVRLAGFLERETGCLIPDADVEGEQFDTIARIHEYLSGRTRAEKP